MDWLSHPHWAQKQTPGCRSVTEHLSPRPRIRVALKDRKQKEEQGPSHLLLSFQAHVICECPSKVTSEAWSQPFSSGHVGESYGSLQRKRHILQGFPLSWSSARESVQHSNYMQKPEHMVQNLITISIFNAVVSDGILVASVQLRQKSGPRPLNIVNSDVPTRRSFILLQCPRGRCFCSLYEGVYPLRGC